MPRQTITYDVLLSCPGDVLDQMDLVREAINSFNEGVGLDNNVVLMLRHWSISAYAESGKKAQESLNSQFVKYCDVVIAIFGDRFGSPTDKYRSGTEEEIEMFLNEGKQVFMFFYEGGRTKDADLEQAQKVRDFKEEYKSKNKGVLVTYSEKKDLKSLLKDNLEMWFLRKEKGKNNISAKKIESEKKDLEGSLCFKTTNLETVSDNLVLSDLKFPFDLAKKQTDIKEEINKIENIKVRTSLAKVGEFEVPCVVEENDKKAITQYAEQNGISLASDFFSLGNLKTVIFDNLDGSEEEKEKKELIECLAKKVKETEVRKYFVDNLKGIKLLWGVVTNHTHSEGEDVWITFEIKKKDFFFPKPVFTGISKPLRNVVDQKFLKNTIPNINAPSYSYHCGNLFDAGYPSDERFVDVLNHFFDFSINEINDTISLNYMIGNIKIGDTKYIPLPIFINENSEDISIGYKITASNIEHCFKGSLKN